MKANDKIGDIIWAIVISIPIALLSAFIFLPLIAGVRLSNLSQTGPLVNLEPMAVLIQLIWIILISFFSKIFINLLGKKSAKYWEIFVSLLIFYGLMITLF